MAHGQSCVLNRADDHAAAMTAQTAWSRRDRLRQEAEPHRGPSPGRALGFVSPHNGDPTHGSVAGGSVCGASRQKPSRAERRASRRDRGDYLSCAFQFAHEAADASASGVPHALSIGGRDVSTHTPGASRRGIAEVCGLFENLNSRRVLHAPPLRDAPPHLLRHART